MRTRILLISTIIFFLVVNIQGLLEYLPLGIGQLFLTLVILLVYVVLVVAWVISVIKIIRERNSDKFRIVSSSIVSILLAIVFIYPFGFNWERLTGRDLLVAYREGVASCMITFKLKENNTFTLGEVCFGVAKTKGHYTIINDSTIRLTHTTPANYLNHYTLAIITKEQYKNGKYLFIKLYNDERKDFLMGFQVDEQYENFSLK